jgi:hypothetical protein
MTGKIFISYRRDDTRWFARSLFSRLEGSFPPERLFMDVDGIRAGQDFVRVLGEQVQACDAMLVLIGPDWLTTHDKAGRRRLDNAEDFVRIEVESALHFDKYVIPVLEPETVMPSAEDLPEPLKPLARRQAFRPTNERFNDDVRGSSRSSKVRWPKRRRIDDGSRPRRMKLGIWPNSRGRQRKQSKTH